MVTLSVSIWQHHSPITFLLFNLNGFSHLTLHSSPSISSQSCIKSAFDRLLFSFLFSFFFRSITKTPLVSSYCTLLHIELALLETKEGTCSWSEDNQLGYNRVSCCNASTTLQSICNLQCILMSLAVVDPLEAGAWGLSTCWPSVKLPFKWPEWSGCEIFYPHFFFKSVTYSQHILLHKQIKIFLPNTIVICN